MRNKYYCSGYIGDHTDGWINTDKMSDEEFKREMTRLFPGGEIIEAYECGDVTAADFIRWNHICGGQIIEEM